MIQLYTYARFASRVLLFAGFVLCQRQLCAAEAHPELYLLKVTIGAQSAADLQTTITTAKPFEYSETRNGEKITLSGELSPPQNGTYHLKLTIAEWRSSTSNSTTTFWPELALGKAWHGGTVAGVAISYMVVLERAPSSR